MKRLSIAAELTYYIKQDPDLRAGNLCLSRGDFEEARRWFSKLEKEKEAWLCRAYEAEGDYDKALSYCDEIQSAHHATTYARIKDYFGEEPPIEELERFIGYNEVKFALTHAYERMGQYRRAWEIARVANLEMGVRTPGGFEGFDIYCRDFSVKKQNGRPIIIVGLPRTGTTLIERMLCCSVDPMGEDGAFISSMVTNKRLKNLNRYVTRRTVNKHPHNWIAIGYIKSLFPDAILVNTTRDWRDIAISCYFRFFSKGYEWAYNLDDIKKVIGQHDEVIEWWRQKYDIYELNYEKLVAEPEKNLKELFDFCDLEWTDRALDYTERKTIKWSFHETRKPIYTKSVGRWKPYAEFEPDYFNES